MNETNQNVVNLISAIIGTGSLKNVNLTNWDEIYKEFCAQDIHGMLFEVMDDLDLNDAKKTKLSIGLGASLKTFHTLMSEQEEVLDLLEEAGICPVVLKGAAAAYNYPNPDYRRMGDIDIIVPQEQFLNAFEILKSAGYKNENELDSAYQRHIGFRKNGGKEIELHRFFSTSENVAQSRILDELVFDGVRNRVVREVAGYQVPMLPDMANGIVLLAHLNQHMISGLGMRQIMDWHMFVCKYLNDEKWPMFKAFSDKIGMTTLAETATYMCKKYFGFADENASNGKITWCDGADDELAEELLDFVFDNGCMGHKYENSDRSVDTTLIYLRNPIRGIKYLDRAGAIHLKDIGAPKVFRPFAFAYQVGHLAHKTREKKISIGKILGGKKKSKNKVEFMKRLGITRM